MGNEVSEVLPELIVALVEEAFDRGVLDRAVHPLGLSIGRMMLRLSRTVLDVVRGAGIFEGMRSVTFGRQRLARQKAMRSCNR